MNGAKFGTHQENTQNGGGDVDSTLWHGMEIKGRTRLVTSQSCRSAKIVVTPIGVESTRSKS
jgi:hypothetical protein